MSYDFIYDAVRSLQRDGCSFVVMAKREDGEKVDVFHNLSELEDYRIMSNVFSETASEVIQLADIDPEDFGLMDLDDFLDDMDDIDDFEDLDFM
jgi:hypothetical protein